jgi:GMP synthase (glutamine-hydrolysing)
MIRSSNGHRDVVVNGSTAISLDLACCYFEQSPHVKGEAHNQTARKRLLLIDAVPWSDAYPAVHSYRDVGRWFSRWLGATPAVALETICVETDLLTRLHRGVDGVILSGSPRDAWSDDPVNDRLVRVVQFCRERRVPFLGVCYGHQVLGRALGGVVGPQPEGLELGNVELNLTSAGLNFPLFRGFTRSFVTLQSHADAVLSLPSGCELLATGGLTPFQSFHWNRLLMGVQFHPEQNPDTLRFIWSGRRDKWRDKVAFDLDQRLDSLRPTPLATRVLTNFVEHFVL